MQRRCLTMEAIGSAAVAARGFTKPRVNGGDRLNA